MLARVGREGMRATWLRAASKSAIASTAAVRARVLAKKSAVTLGARGFASLVSSEWIQESKASGKKMLIIDCEQPTAFQRAHIPKAQSFALASSGLKDPTPDSTGVMSEVYFEQVLELLQVEEDATLVFYDDDCALKSTRLWWVFHHYGFPKEQLKVLDGGWKQWVADGSAVSTGHAVEIHTSASLWTELGNTNALVDFSAVQQGLADGSSQFVDARTPAEYTGENLVGNLRGGHVPGAVNFDWVDAVDQCHNGKFKSKDELEAVLTDEFGLQKDKQVITYCQRGIRAAHTAFVLSEVLEFPDVKIYENSMSEYLNRTDTVVE